MQAYQGNNTGQIRGQESCGLSTQQIGAIIINNKVKAKEIHTRTHKHTHPHAAQQTTEERNSMLALLHSHSCRLSEQLVMDESPCENRLPARAVS